MHIYLVLCLILRLPIRHDGFACLEDDSSAITDECKSICDQVHTREGRELTALLGGSENLGRCAQLKQGGWVREHIWREYWNPGSFSNLLPSCHDLDTFILPHTPCQSVWSKRQIQLAMDCNLWNHEPQNDKWEGRRAYEGMPVVTLFQNYRGGPQRSPQPSSSVYLCSQKLRAWGRALSVLHFSFYTKVLKKNVIYTPMDVLPRAELAVRHRDRMLVWNEMLGVNGQLLVLTVS